MIVFETGVWTKSSQANFCIRAVPVPLWTVYRIRSIFRPDPDRQPWRSDPSWSDPVPGPWWGNRANHDVIKTVLKNRCRRTGSGFSSNCPTGSGFSSDCPTGPGHRDRILQNSGCGSSTGAGSRSRTLSTVYNCKYRATVPVGQLKNSTSMVRYITVLVPVHNITVNTSMVHNIQYLYGTVHNSAVLVRVAGAGWTEAPAISKYSLFKQLCVYVNYNLVWMSKNGMT